MRINTINEKGKIKEKEEIAKEETKTFKSKYITKTLEGIKKNVIKKIEIQSIILKSCVEERW